MIRKILTSSLITLVAVGGFFMNIEKHEGAISDTIGYQISGVSEVMAAEGVAKTPAADDSASKLKDMLNNVVAGLNIVLGIVTFVVSPLIMLAGWLMSPDWTSGDLFLIRPMMHSLWVTVSNILYFVYAVLLIVIALATMFNQEKFGYKVMLPKLALGIILVPFTWWFVQWTISLASVVTASVISIPQDTIPVDNGWWNSEIIPKSITYDNSSGSGKLEMTKDCAKDPCIAPSVFLKSSGGQWGSLLVYAYGVFKFHEVNQIDGTMNAISTIGDIINQGIMAVLMFLVFGILVIALVFMLAMRAIKLWMYAIFSPIFTLHFVVGKDILGDKLDDFSLKEFIGLAFVPAVVGLVLSFGLVIIATIKTPGIDTTKGNCLDDQTKGCSMEILGNPENKITSKVTVDGKIKTSSTEIKYGGVTYTYKGATGKASTDMVAGAQGIFSMAGGMFGTIIIDIISLIFIWAAFMAAKNVSKAVNAAVQPFEDMGKKIGALGMSLPKYMPLPVPGGSIAGVGKMVDVASRIPEAKMLGELEKNEHYKTLKRIAGDTGSVATNSKVQGALDGKDINALREALKDQNARNSVEHIPTLVKENQKTASMIQTNSVMQTTEKTAALDLLEKIKKDGGSEEDKYKLMALIKGAKKDELSIGGSAEAWINKNVGKGSSDGTGGTTGYTATNIAGKDGGSVNVNIEGASMQVTVDGKKIEGLKEEELKSLRTALKGQSETNIMDKLLQVVNKDVANTIITKIKENDNPFT